MKRSRLSSFYLLLLATLLTAPGLPALAGPGDSSGGGNRYALDFIHTALSVVYPWLQQNGNLLKPKINADAFLMAVNPKNIQFAPEVFENCQFEVRREINLATHGPQDRQMQACYNANSDMIYLSIGTDETSGKLFQWPVDETLSETKFRLIAHEIFRRMHKSNPLIDDDLYQISEQIEQIRVGVRLRAQTKCSIKFGTDPGNWMARTYGAVYVGDQPVTDQMQSYGPLQHLIELISQGFCPTPIPQDCTVKFENSENAVFAGPDKVSGYFNDTDAAYAYLNSLEKINYCSKHTF